VEMKEKVGKESKDVKMKEKAGKESKYMEVKEKAGKDSKDVETKGKAGKESKDVEMKDVEKLDDHTLSNKVESDNETLSVWKKRTAKAT